MPGLIAYSNTAGNTPSSLGNGDLGINQADGKLYYRTSSGTVAQLSAGGSSSASVAEYASTASFPAAGTAAVLYIATDSRRLYSWTGSAYAEVSPTDSLHPFLLMGG